MSRIIIPNAINGIDVSSIQRGLDAKLIKEAGFEFAYVQSSRYSSTRDLSFDTLVDKLRTAGLRVGAYHFCSHDSDPIAQAQFFYRACGGLGKTAGELPPMVDWEFCTPSHYPEHPAHCVRFAEVFMAEAERLWYPDNANRLVRRYPVLYSYPNYCATHQPALATSRLGKWPFCYASYPNKKMYVPVDVSEVPFHPVPLPWKTYQMVQYSGNDGALVPGVKSACDRLVFGGSRVMWEEYLGYCAGGLDA